MQQSSVTESPGKGLDHILRDVRHPFVRLIRRPQSSTPTNDFKLSAEDDGREDEPHPTPQTNTDVCD